MSIKKKANKVSSIDTFIPTLTTTTATVSHVHGVCDIVVMGAAATVSKDDEGTTNNQKTAPSLTSQGRNKNTAMVVCSACKTPLSIFRRKVSFLNFYYF